MPKQLTELLAAHRSASEAATAGPYETYGARHIWSPEQASNIATVSEPRGDKTDVGYEELSIGSDNFHEAYANATHIAANDPAVVLALVAVAEAAASVLHHDERGQGVLYAEAMQALHTRLDTLRQQLEAKHE